MKTGLRCHAATLAGLVLLIVVSLTACSCGLQRQEATAGGRREILIAYNASGYLEDEVLLPEGGKSRLDDIFGFPPDLGHVLSFSSEGVLIAGGGFRDGGLPVYRRLVLRNPDGSGDLLQNPGPDQFGERVKKVLFPSISRDGSRVLTVEGFPAGNRLEDGRLFMMNADGSGKRCISCWSGSIWVEGQYRYLATPTGGRVLVYRPGEADRMAVVDAADGRRLYEWGIAGRLQTVGNVMELADISPDGRYVAFVGPDPESRVDYAGRPRGDCLYLADVNLRRTSVLLRARDFGSLGAYDSLRLSYPQWSPDGNNVLVTSRHKDRRVGIVTLKGGLHMLAGAGGGRDSWAGCWSPDGKRIAFLSAYPGGAPSVWIATLDGRQNTLLGEGHAEELEYVYRWAVTVRAR